LGLVCVLPRRMNLLDYNCDWTRSLNEKSVDGIEAIHRGAVLAGLVAY